MSSQLLLRDENVYPDDVVLKSVLGDVFPVYQELTKTLTGSDFSIDLTWNYYKDGKSWLCKVTKKKKTIFWLSVWEGFFKAGFYFTETTGAGIATLDIDLSYKETFATAKPIGKLIPLVFDITRKEQLKDLLEVVRYKLV